MGTERHVKRCIPPFGDLDVAWEKILAFRIYFFKKGNKDTVQTRA
jgi:hypothetical protein